jgi:hypothetical protein
MARQVIDENNTIVTVADAIVIPPSIEEAVIEPTVEETQEIIQPGAK